MVKIDFHKEIKIIPLYKVVLPSIISYIIVIIAYFGGEDGLFFLVSWMIDPFVFLYIPFVQRAWCNKEKSHCKNIHLLIWFLIQIAFGIIVLSAMYDGTPYWDCLELYMRWTFWASIYNIISGIICFVIIIK